MVDWETPAGVPQVLGVAVGADQEASVLAQVLDLANGSQVVERVAEKVD